MFLACLYTSFTMFNMETTCMSTDERMDRDMVRIHDGTLLSHKIEWNSHSHINGPSDDHTKWSKSDKERWIYDITDKWNLKKWYKWTYKIERASHTEIKLMVTKGEAGEG